MALSNTPSLLEINAELGVSGKSLLECINLAGKTGVWNSQLDFAGYSAGSISLNPTTVNIDNTLQVVSTTVTSSSAWETISYPAWATPQNTSGNSGDTVTISVDINLYGNARTGIVVFRLISNTAVTASFSINQAA